MRLPSSELVPAGAVAYGGSSRFGCASCSRSVTPSSNRLYVASHGRFLAIGDFLAPAARRELAATIREALARWRAAIGPEPAG